MKEEIYKICTQLNDGQIAVSQAQEQLLNLFSVVGQSKLLLSFFNHIQREYNIEADITFGEALQSFKSMPTNKDVVNAIKKQLNDNGYF